MGTNIEIEARQAYAAYVEARRRAVAGEAAWSALADFFTEDAVFIDPAWGRVEGRGAIARFMDESMTGLEGWDFPEVWTVVEGRRIVTMWDQVLPADGAGERRRQPGLSVLYYAGDGRFAYEMDLLNMQHVLADLSETGWRPGDGFTPPPAEPERDWSLGPAADLA